MTIKIDSDNNSVCKLLDIAIESKVSDVHFTTNARETISIRIKGDITKLTDLKISDVDLVDFFREYDNSSTEGVMALVSEGMKPVDTAFTYKGRRFRANVSHSRKGVSTVLRMLGDTILPLEKLGMPPSVLRVSNFNEGMVLIVGATGSGKSTTLASIIDDINERQPVHIITVEHPIEYVYEDKKALISQKEVGKDCISFENAVVAAMRQDPDILLIGEMRDYETIGNALTMAETGHLVFGTLHSNSVIEAISRMVDVFPDESKNMARTQIASVLRAVVSQQLIKSSITKDYVALCEVLMMTDVFRNMIKENRAIAQIRENLRNPDNKIRGSVHIVDNAYDHIVNKRLAFEDILGRITGPDLKILADMLRVEIPEEYKS